MINQNDQISKDSIRQRMYQQAALFWNVSSVEELDPIVLLLIESLCSEIYTIEQELQDSHLRILEKIANLLTPSDMIFPKPAHAIAKMDIIEPTLLINKNTVLQAKKPVTGNSRLWNRFLNLCSRDGCSSGQWENKIYGL